MNLRKLSIASGVALVMMSGISYGFGLPKMPSVPGLPAGGGSAVNADAVDTFLSIGAESNKRISDSRLILATALATKEERAKIMSQQEQIKKGLDAKDKKAAEQLKEFQSSLDAEIKAKTSNEQAMAGLKSLNAEQVDLVVGSMMNLTHGILLQQQQVTAGQDLISAVSANPMLATKLPAIKDTITSMTTNISGTVGYLTKFPSLFRSMGVSAVLPKSVADKPKAVSADSLEKLFSN